MQRSDFLSEMQIEKTVKIAVASLKMEGLNVDEQAKKWCKDLLKKEITLEEYILLVKTRAGVSD